MEIPLLFILSQSFSNLKDISVFNSFQVIWCVWQTSYLYVCSPFWSCCRAVRSNCSIGELVMISSRGIWHYFFCLRSMQPQWDIDLWIYYTRCTYNYIAIRYKNPCKAPEASPAELLRITTTSMSPVCRAKPRKSRNDRFLSSREMPFWQMVLDCFLCLRAKRWFSWILWLLSQTCVFCKCWQTLT